MRKVYPFESKKDYVQAMMGSHPDFDVIEDDDWWDSESRNVIVQHIDGSFFALRQEVAITANDDIKLVIPSLEAREVFKRIVKVVRYE